MLEFISFQKILKNKGTEKTEDTSKDYLFLRNLKIQEIPKAREGEI